MFVKVHVRLRGCVIICLFAYLLPWLPACVGVFFGRTVRLLVWFLLYLNVCVCLPVVWHVHKFEVALACT